MLTVSAFAEELIILKQCQWLKKFNLNLIFTHTCTFTFPLEIGGESRGIDKVVLKY